MVCCSSLPVSMVGITGAVLSSEGGPSKGAPVEAGIPTAPMKSASGRTTGPPWDAPSDPSARVEAAGLPMLGAEGEAEHIHAHLDVIVNSKPVAVPADIGIDLKAGKISLLHTHVSNGGE